jgi:tetratricopeptide (TPR) repeat protein
MKTEHRKELKTNALADALGKFIKGQWKAPSSTTLVVGLFALLLVALVVAWFIYASVAGANRAALWVKLGSATNLDDLEELAAKNPGTTPGRVADLERARGLLRQGVEQLCDQDVKKRDEAPNLLQQAGDLYDKVAKEGLDNPLLLHEALLGAAKAKESQGKIDEAIADYQKLAKMGESLFTKEAEEQAKYLEEHKKDVKEFYAKLAEQNKKGHPLSPPTLPTLPTP